MQTAVTGSVQLIVQLLIITNKRRTQNNTVDEVQSTLRAWTIGVHSDVTQCACFKMILLL